MPTGPRKAPKFLWRPTRTRPKFDRARQLLHKRLSTQRTIYMYVRIYMVHVYIYIYILIYIYDTHVCIKYENISYVNIIHHVCRPVSVRATEFDSVRFEERSAVT